VKHLARWAWVVVLGTALALSWWSLETFARHYGMPWMFAGMVSAAVDGGALVLADLAMQRAVMADSAVGVKLLTMTTVSLSAWLNFEHGLLFGYPRAIQVLFAAPSVLSGLLFEQQLGIVHRARLRQLDRVAEPLPRFGAVVWLFHPFGTLHRLSQIAASRLRSIPLDVMDWQRPLAAVTVVPLSTPVDEPAEELAEVAAEAKESAGDVAPEPEVLAPAVPETAAPTGEGTHDDALRIHKRTGRAPVPDELYLVKLRELVAEAGDVVPSARQVARQLGIGQDRARRLVAMLSAEQEAMN
jgi:hypothetical protein